MGTLKPPPPTDKDAAAKYEVLNEHSSFERILARLPEEEQDAFRKLNHNQYQTAFIDRVFYLYRCMGKDKNDAQRPPEVLALARVMNFSFDLERGFVVSVLDEMSNVKQALTVIPQKLFGFEVMVRVPTSFSLRCNMLQSADGQEKLDHSAGLYVKTRNKPEFFSRGNVYLLTPPEMAQLYPAQDWRPAAQW